MLLKVILVSLLGASKAAPVSEAGSCVCFTSDAVNIHSTPCGSTILSTISKEQCARHRGQSVSCSLHGTTWTFLETDLGWVASDFVEERADNLCSLSKDAMPGICQRLDKVYRSEWRARPPARPPTELSLPLERVALHHSYGAPCYDSERCIIRMQQIQRDHIDDNDWLDIGYTWCVGEDGKAYEGRGWDYRGAHTGGFNSIAHGICVIGNFMHRQPNDIAKKAVWDLIDCGRDLNKLTRDSTIAGHRDYDCTTECPGTSLYYDWLVHQEDYQDPQIECPDPDKLMVMKTKK